MRITIIGAGNMGGAIARGLCMGNTVANSDITVTNPSQPKLDRLKNEYPDINITNDNKAAVKDADWIILAVKPWKIQEVIDEIKPLMDYARQVIISVAAGIGINDLKTLLNNGSTELPTIIYMIPNTAISICESMTIYVSTSNDEKLERIINDVFGELGEISKVEERQINAGMTVASCGTAFAMKYARAAMEAGIEMGLYPKDAMKMVAQTMKGAAEILLQNDTHPEIEIDKVTTPGGLTIKGINEMEHSGFTSAVIKAHKATLQ